MSVSLAKPHASYCYRIPVSPQEVSDLRWLAARYDTSEILVDNLNDDETMIVLPEYMAWSYLDALANENGNPDQVLPTCLGGDLGERLIDLYDRIV